MNMVMSKRNIVFNWSNIYSLQVWKCLLKSAGPNLWPFPSPHHLPALPPPNTKKEYEIKKKGKKNENWGERTEGKAKHLLPIQQGLVYQLWVVSGHTPDLHFDIHLQLVS